jgi:hypothetical protein
MDKHQQPNNPKNRIKKAHQLNGTKYVGQSSATQ